MSSSPTSAKQRESLLQKIVIGVTYGLINAAVCIPVMMSFGTIIYADPFFYRYLPPLIKLTLLSSMIHQLTFSSMSSLPYSVGQVQDAGLIFLSTMSSSIVKLLKHKDGDVTDGEILATTTITLSLSTVILGLSLMIVGKLRLATYVRFLPTPVTGGYLAYIGYFCAKSGLSLMTGIHFTTLHDAVTSFGVREITLAVPGVLCGMLTFYLVGKIRHMAVLPVCMVSIIALFYVVLYIADITVEEARSDSWLPTKNEDASDTWYENYWRFLDFDMVIWSAVPRQALTIVSMTIVVGLSSCLDIAAIELELEGSTPPPSIPTSNSTAENANVHEHTQEQVNTQTQPIQHLDYNHELYTVGLSNIVSGGLGGYTGSYIFSQTIFNLRCGLVDNRIAGFIVAFCEGIVIICPFPIISYIPTLFFGALLTMISSDLLHQWLLSIRLKVTKTEYTVLLLTFFTAVGSGRVEYAILVGTVIYYVVTYLQGRDLPGSLGGVGEGGEYIGVEEGPDDVGEDASVGGVEESETAPFVVIR